MKERPAVEIGPRLSGAQSTRPGGTTSRRARRRQVAMAKWGRAYVLVTPAIVIILAMMVFPVMQTVAFSLSTVALPSLETSFAGLDNFVAIFKDPETASLLGRTLLWIFGTVVLRFLLGMGAALVFNARVRGSMWLRILTLLPWTVPSVVAANLWRWILQSDHGLLNQTLRGAGMDGLALNWLGDTSLAMLSVIVAYSWAGFPFVMLLILAGLQSVPDEIYEAAQMDGANWWSSFRYITLPSLRAILAVVIILEVVQAVNSFDTLMIMTGGGPANATQTWGLEIYRVGFTNFNFGGAAALSVLLFTGSLLVFIGYGVLTSGAHPTRRRPKLGDGRGAGEAP